MLLVLAIVAVLRLLLYLAFSPAVVSLGAEMLFLVMLLVLLVVVFPNRVLLPLVFLADAVAV